MEKDEFIEIYNKSMIELKNKIEQNKRKPSEKVWDEYAFKNGYLSSKTLGYVSGNGFYELCKKIIKSLKN